MLLFLCYNKYKITSGVFFMDLETLYKHNEDNMPSKITLLLIRKALLLKEIFTIEPDISFRYKTNVTFDCVTNAYFDCTWNNNIVITPESNNTDILSIIETLKSTDKEFEKFILNQTHIENMDDESSYDYLRHSIRDFTCYDAIINKENLNKTLNELVENFLSDTPREKEVHEFIQSLVREEEYKPEIISLYGAEIAAIPVTVDDTYNHLYLEWGMYKDDFVLDQVKEFLKESFNKIFKNNILSSTEKNFLFLSFEDNIFTLNIAENSLNCIVYSDQYSSNITTFDDHPENDFAEVVSDKIKIINNNSLQFMLDHIACIFPHMFDSDKTLQELQSYNEKVFIQNQLNNDNNCVPKSSRRL